MTLFTMEGSGLEGAQVKAQSDREPVITAVREHPTVTNDCTKAKVTLL